MTPAHGALVKLYNFTVTEVVNECASHLQPILYPKMFSLLSPDIAPNNPGQLHNNKLKGPRDTGVTILSVRVMSL